MPKKRKKRITQRSYTKRDIKTFLERKIHEDFPDAHVVSLNHNTLLVQHSAKQNNLTYHLTIELYN